MSIKNKVKSAISFLLHGKRAPVLANIQYLSPSNMLVGKKIIVTGGGRGLGFAMAKQFKMEGADVLIIGRNEESLKQASKQLHCNYLQFDLTDISNIGDLIAKADDILDGANVLVNNAGISLHENTFFNVTPDSFDKQFDTNLKAPFFLTQEFIKRIQSRNSKGDVLFVSSETGETVDFRPYGFTKAAVNSMVKGLAYLFRTDGIRINAIAPGVTASDMTGLSADGDIYSGRYGIGRYYLPEEVAQIASLIISDISGCISGQVITCNNAQTVNARWK
jgi:3-oxoacyl-[acyl-carrier protein] reductase